MAKEKGLIVIKKITVAGGGHHGGSWKVALADFMTAMMAFFLVMWLLAQSAETKKAVSDYFSTPSIIEYNFQNYGVELTLEKLFLDLVNEPLKAFQQFMEPADKTPNILDSGSQKVVMMYVADQLSDLAKNVSVNPDGFDFDIPDNVMFKSGSAEPQANFVNVMDKLKTITTGLEDADVNITSMLFVQAVKDQSQQTATHVASERADLITKKLQAGLESNTVQVNGNINVKEKRGEIDPNKLIGLIRVSIRQKDTSVDGSKRRKLDTLFGKSDADMSVYDNFVKQISSGKSQKATKPKIGRDETLKNPVDEEFQKPEESVQE